MTMYASALAVGLLAWDPWVTPAMVAVAVAVHSLSICDTLRACAYPGYALGVPRVAVMLGLVCFLYLPLGLVASQLAFSIEVEHGRSRFLVNLHAFDQSGPSAGDWVALRRGHSTGCRVGRLVASAGEEFEARAGVFTVGGSPLPFRLVGPGPADFRLTVPRGFVLVESLASHAGDDDRTRPLLLVSVGEIIGRPWAQIGPLSERRLLF
jgi:hypothetical protein